MKQSYLVILDTTGKPEVLDSEIFQAINERFSAAEVWGLNEDDTAQASRYVGGIDPFKEADYLPSAEEIAGLPD